MTPRQKLELEQSEKRQRLNALVTKTDPLTDDEAKERDGIVSRLGSIEPELRAAILVDEQETKDAEVREAAVGGGDPETRERLELRSKADIGAYFVGRMRGQLPKGAEAELSAAAFGDRRDVPDGAIPLEIFEPDAAELRRRWERQGGPETRDITPSPATVGVNLDPIRPAVFAPSIADKLMLDMPAVGSGTYATGTITTSVSADAVAKGGSVPATAGAITVSTTTPHRIGGEIQLAVEDIAAIGPANFASAIRENLQLVTSDHLDDNLINGTGNNNELTGFFQRLTDPADPTAAATFDDYIAAFADGIDGLWATMMTHVSIVAGVDTYKLSARTFRDIAAADLGDISAADYLAAKTAGWWTNKRMPDADGSNFQAAILCRKGRSGLRLSVCPHWGYLSVDDIYSRAGEGERIFVVSILVGDVILVQPDAYAQVAFQTA